MDFGPGQNNSQLYCSGGNKDQEIKIQKNQKLLYKKSQV